MILPQVARLGWIPICFKAAWARNAPRGGSPGMGTRWCWAPGSVPFARSVVSIPAGTSRMPPARFAVLTALGSGVWNAVLIGAGYLLGANWARVSGWVGAYSDVVLVAVAIMAAIYLTVRGLRKHRKDRE